MYKFVHKNEIHIFKQELQSFSQVLGFLKQSFKELPNKFSLFYFDSEGDQIRLSNDEDIKALSQTKFQAKPKIYIQAPSEEGIFLLQSEALLDSVIMDENGISMIKMKDELEQSYVNREIKKEKSEEKMKTDIEKLKEHLEEFVQNEVKKQLDERKKKKKEKRKNWGKTIKQNIENLFQQGAQIFEQNEQFEQPQQQQQQPKPKVPQNQVIHNGVICDGCEQANFSGIRYKCSVCRDFDYCEKCEEKMEHNHPFLKIRNPEEAPISIVVAFEENNQVFSNQCPRRMACQRSRGRKEKSQEKKTTQRKKSQKKSQEEIKQNQFPSLISESSPSNNNKYTWTVQNQAKQISEFIGGTPEQYYEVCSKNSNKKLDEIVLVILSQKQKQNQQQQQQPIKQEQPQEEMTTQIIPPKPKISIQEKNTTVSLTQVPKKESPQTEETQEQKKNKDLTTLYSQEVINKAKKVADVMTGDYVTYLEFVNQNQEKSIDILITMLLMDQI